MRIYYFTIFVIFFSASLADETNKFLLNVSFGNTQIGKSGETHVFRIYSKSDERDEMCFVRLKTKQIVFTREISLGSEIIRGVRAVVFGGSIEELLVIDWQWGARTFGTTIYGLLKDGNVGEILRDGGDVPPELILSATGERILLVQRKSEERGWKLIKYVFDNSGGWVRSEDLSNSTWSTTPSIP